MCTIDVRSHSACAERYPEAAAVAVCAGCVGQTVFPDHCSFNDLNQLLTSTASSPSGGVQLTKCSVCDLPGHRVHFPDKQTCSL